MWIFGNFFKFLTLTLSCFDLGSDVNQDLMSITSVGNHGATGVSQNAGVLIVLVIVWSHNKLDQNVAQSTAMMEVKQQTLHSQRTLDISYSQVSYWVLWQSFSPFYMYNHYIIVLFFFSGEFVLHAYILLKLILNIEGKSVSCANLQVINLENLHKKDHPAVWEHWLFFLIWTIMYISIYK